ncbi:MAG: ExbD/TolR family protein [Planctomycetota bacterium]
MKRWGKRGIGITLAVFFVVRSVTWFVADVDLPYSNRGHWVVSAPWTRIDLNHRGEVRVDGFAMSLDGLRFVLDDGWRRNYLLSPSQATYRDIYRYEPVLLCVDRRAQAAHVHWIMGILEWRGYNRLYFAVNGLLGPAAVPVVLHRRIIEEGDGYYHDMVVRPGPTFELPAPEPGTFPVVLFRPQNGVPFGEVLEAFERIEAAGFRHVQWASAYALTEVAMMKRLPRVRADAHVHSIWNLYDVNPFPLPLAPNATIDRDDDEDNRVLVNLDGQERLLYRDHERTHGELATILKQAKREYNLRQKMKGRLGMRGDRTRVFVLVRAHKDARYEAVRRLLLLLDEHGFDRIQFAVETEPESWHTREECARVGREPTDRAPLWDAALSAKLPFHAPFDGAAARTTVRVRDGLYRIGSRTIADPSEIANRAPRPIEVDATPDTPWSHVVALLDRLGSEDVALTRE